MNKELHLTNDLSEVKQLSDFVANIASELDIEDKERLKLNLALEEAIVNVILYAYTPSDKGKDICMKVNADEKSIIFRLEDEGIAFDPTSSAMPDIALSAKDRPIGGLGIHLIREIMSQVKYERRGNKNVLTMIKDLH